MSWFSNERNVVYVLLCCGIFAISFNVAAIAAVLPAISLDLNLPAIEVSRIVSYYMVPYGLGALLYAPLTRYFSYKKILVGSLAIYALASFYCAGARSLNDLMVGRILVGISGASAIPVGLMLIGQLFEKYIRGRRVGLFFSCGFFASMAGIILSGVAHWRWLFVLPAVMGVLIVLGLLFVPMASLKHVQGLKINYWKTLCHPSIRNIFVFVFVLSMLYHATNQWFGIYLNDVYHFDKRHISFFFLLMAVSSAVGQMWGGHLSDKRGRILACWFGVMMMAGATIFLVGRYPAFLLAVILCLFSMGWTIGHNGVSTVLTDFPDDHRAEIASLNSSIRFVSGGWGFSLSSFFIEKSFSWTFLGLGILMLITALLIKKLVIE
ncbi:MAG: MFS transporter [Candidatus Omnitrophica bacterium]|nr:MFS transporter [Candidatus Omnitrophota bacterium]